MIATEQNSNNDLNGFFSRLNAYPLALALLNRPTLEDRLWTDGSMSPEEFQKILAANADALTRQGCVRGKDIWAALKRSQRPRSRLGATYASPRYDAFQATNRSLVRALAGEAANLDGDCGGADADADAYADGSLSFSMRARAACAPYDGRFPHGEGGAAARDGFRNFQGAGIAGPPFSGMASEGRFQGWAQNREGCLSTGSAALQASLFPLPPMKPTASDPDSGSAARAVVGKTRLEDRGRDGGGWDAAPGTSSPSSARADPPGQSEPSEPADPSLPERTGGENASSAASNPSVPSDPVQTVSKPMEGAAKAEEDPNDLALLAIPAGSPKVAALVRLSSTGQESPLDVEALLHGGMSWTDPRAEVASAICAAGNTAAILVDMGTSEVLFASREAFRTQSVDGPFLGQTCLAPEAPDAVKALVRNSCESPFSVIRREVVGDLAVVCLERQVGAAEVREAACRYGMSDGEADESLRMVAGLSCKDSALRIGLSPDTVRQRRKAIYRKMRVATLGTAVARIMGVRLPPAIVPRSR